MLFFFFCNTLNEGVIHGSWSCWSAWSLCSGGRRSRSRSCSNPSPQNGGHHCIGELTETSGCEEDEELQYLKSEQTHVLIYSTNICNIIDCINLLKIQ